MGENSDISFDWENIGRDKSNESEFNPHGLLVFNLLGDDAHLLECNKKYQLRGVFGDHENLVNERLPEILEWAKDTVWLQESLRRGVP